MAIYSAVKQVPVPQDIAITGEISIRGKIKPVGGIPEKIYGAKRAGIRRVYIPKANLDNIANRDYGLDIIGVSHVNELMVQMFLDPRREAR